MKKKTVSLLLVAAMAVGMLAGCGGGKSSISRMAHPMQQKAMKKQKWQMQRM